MPAKLDVAIVCHNFPPHVGGVEFVAYEQGRRLANRGHAVTVYTSEVASAPADEPAIELPPNLRLRRLPSRLRVGNMPLLKHLSEVTDHQLVHLHLPFLFGAEIVGPLTRRHRIPLVVTFHAGDVPVGVLDLVRTPGMATLGHFYIRHLALRLVGHAAKVCLLSEAQDHHPSSPLGALLSRHPERRAVVPNGVDLDRFRVPTPEEAREARRALTDTYGLPDDAPAAMWCGRLDSTSLRYKRLDIGLRALQLSETPFHLLVCGEGPLREHWAQVVREMGLDDVVHFTGAQSRDQMVQRYWGADLYVMSSVGPEASPLTLLEAMATATPVIAPALLDIRAVIESDREGILFPPGDASALGAAIEHAYGLPVEERASIGNAGRERTNASFSWDVSTDRLEAALQAALSDRSYALDAR